MTRYLIPLVAALLLSACSCPRKGCANCHYPTAPTTRAACPQAKPKCGCGKKQARPQTRQQNQPLHQRVGPNRHPVSLGEVTDYLPGQPPSYLSI